MVVRHRAAAGRHAGEVAVAAAAGGRHPAVTGVIERVCVMVSPCISDRQAAARGTGVARIDIVVSARTHPHGDPRCPHSLHGLHRC